MTSPAREPSDTTLPLAVAVFVHHDERVLLIQRAHHLPLGGYWTPVTGRLEPDEDLATAAHREVREEVGLAIELGPELTRGPTSNGLFLLVYFTARYLDGSLRPDPTEVADARWLARAEALAQAPMLPTTRRILESAWPSSE